MGMLDSLMSPLGKQHCVIIYYLGIISFFMACLSFILFIFGLFTKANTFNVIFVGVLYVLYFLALYYFSRIYYSICISSLR
jgi:hypothetical protein